MVAPNHVTLASFDRYGGQPLDPKTIGQQSKAVLIFKTNITIALFQKFDHHCGLNRKRFVNYQAVEKIDK